LTFAPDKYFKKRSDENAPVSAWEGVTVGAQGRVVKLASVWNPWELQLQPGDNRVTGSIPAALGQLTALTSLDLGRAVQVETC
jgi:hypothetical protein